MSIPTFIVWREEVKSLCGVVFCIKAGAEATINGTSALGSVSVKAERTWSLSISVEVSDDTLW
ncbi:unnamed protein product [marine sediment metagenome]|uniref:Uncharacterized protein n=1 Tax=marine sediment metagenome TaxID=412755 RepID=X1T169_9ZZZZ